jgi:hypothetical protein
VEFPERADYAPSARWGRQALFIVAEDAVWLGMLIYATAPAAPPGPGSW